MQIARNILDSIFHFLSIIFYKHLEIHILIKVLEWGGVISQDFLSSSFATHCKYIQIYLFQLC